MPLYFPIRRCSHHACTVTGKHCSKCVRPRRCLSYTRDVRAKWRWRNETAAHCWAAHSTMTGASSSVPGPVLDSSNANSVPGSLRGSSVFGVGLEKSFAWYLSSEKYSASTKFAPKRLPFIAFFGFRCPFNCCKLNEGIPKTHDVTISSHASCTTSVKAGTRKFE